MTRRLEHTGRILTSSGDRSRGVIVVLVLILLSRSLILILMMILRITGHRSWILCFDAERRRCSGLEAGVGLVVSGGEAGGQGVVSLLRRGRGHGVGAGLAEVAGRVLQGGLLPVHVLLEEDQVLPEDVSYKDWSPGTELLLAESAHFLASHLKQRQSKPGIEL